jgi:WD40 repeat protein
MNKVNTYKGHTQPIKSFILSSEFIFSLAQDGEFIIFNLRSGEIIKKKQFNHDFEIMMHPTTYINKLVFAGGNKIELWNIIEDKKIYEFS